MELELNVGEFFAADKAGAGYRITFYFPNKDKSKKIIDNVEDYVENMMDILTETNRGVTRLPINKGKWKDDLTGVHVEEDTIILYSDIDNIEEFSRNLHKIRGLLHKFGVETRQDAVKFDFQGYENPNGYMVFESYYIKNYNKKWAEL